MRLSAMSTGMGTDNVEIVLAEVMEITDQPSFIRIGSSGALQPEIELGDLIVSIGAVRLENTTDFYVHPGYPAIAHREVVAALEAACLERGYRHHLGLTATASGFYARRAGRCARSRFAILSLRRSCGARRVANLEMESSALFVLTSLAGLRAERSVRRTHRGSKERSWKERQRSCGGTLHRCRAGIHLLWVKDQEQDGDPDGGHRDRRARRGAVTATGAISRKKEATDRWRPTPTASSARQSAICRTSRRSR